MTLIFEPHEFPPPSSTVHVEFGAQTRCGAGHTVNEDHHLIIQLSRHQETLRSSLSDEVIAKRFDEFGYAMIVADGLGDWGEASSRIALATLMDLVLHFGKWNLRIDHDIAQEIMERARRFYRHVDGTMIQRGLTDHGPGLQTTLTAAFGAGRDLFFAHVGHSRAYLFRDGQLMRLTRDHTIGRRHSTTTPVAPLVDLNVAARDLKHILTETIGMGGPVGPKIDLERFQLLDLDRVLVCTNGLTDMVDEKVVAEVLDSDRSPEDHCRTLVDLALAAGGDDDATALVARFRIPESLERQP